MSHSLVTERVGPPPIRFTWMVFVPGYLALHRAVSRGDVDAARQVVTSVGKEALSRRDLRGRTPLHVAVVVDNISLGELLLDAGADLEARDNHSHTPLMVAIGEGNMPFAELLLRHGANPNSATDTGATVLNGAVGVCREDLVRLLLDHGAEVSSAGVLHVCVGAYMTDYDQQARHRIFDLLVARGANIEDQPEPGETPLAMAAFAGDYECARKLLQAGARHDIPSPGAGGMHPLHVAISSKQVRVAELLIEAGADVNATADDGNTPLIYASCYREMVPVVRRLLDRGAAVNVKGAGGKTAADFASANGNREILELLSRRAK